MQYRLGICKECPEGKNEKMIVNRTKMLCQVHNQERLDKGKEQKKPYVYKRKETGEWNLFLAIWAVRDHACTNCGIFLGDIPQPHFFSHIKSKGAHPELRLEPKNINLLCFECHREYDQGTKEKFDARRSNVG